MYREMKFYRFEAVQYASLDPDNHTLSKPTMTCTEYNLFKETEKGYWIGHGSLGDRALRSNAIWVSKTSRKRHAYPSKLEALNGYIMRTKRRVLILKTQTKACEIGLVEAEKLKQIYL